MTQQYDQIIIGAGITGISIAFEPSKKGYKTLVVDKLPATGHGFGNIILMGSEDPDCDKLDWVDDPDHFNRNVTNAQ